MPATPDQAVFERADSERADSPRRPAATPERRGMALLTAILAIVVISVLVLGGLFTSTQEFRGGRNLLVEQRAFAVAEYGLNYEVSNWDRGRNLDPASGGLAIGGIDSSRREVAAGDSTFVKVTRLTDNTFWVVSEGRTSLGMASMESGRRTNALVRLAYPTIEPKGAITTAGDIELTGASTVDGRNTDPAQWGGECAGISGSDVPAINAAPTSKVEYKEKNIPSTPPVLKDSVAADSNTYIRYGSETWETLVANADIKIKAGSGKVKSNILPVGTDTTCEASINNWGEPARPGIKGCYNRFPIIYAEEDLHINANGRGQGILLVNGNFEINGKFEFYGIVIVRDNITKGNGNAKIYGAVYARDAELGDASFISGTQDVYYSACAVEQALRGSAILTRVKERHWTQMF